MTPVLVGALLAGCGGGGPDRYGRTSWDVRNSPVPVPYPQKRPGDRPAVVRPAESGMVTVRAGDTVFALSRRHKADVQSIIRTNGLEPPYVLHVGQRLRIPAETVHVVQKGETSYSISRAYGVDLATLARVNGLGPPYQITVGQRLVLPGAGQRPEQRPGQQAATAGSAPSGGKIVASSAPSQSRAPLPPPPPASGFVWPARGKILSGYGPKARGLHNDGINIARPAGSLFHAADGGVVVYAGNDIKAYGNLILLRHEDGWVTAYAHAEEFLVQRGDRVRRGQPIGRVGSTGNVAVPQLHFEIRQGRRAVDPLRQLPG